jgi:hypothetical protein
MEKIIKLNVGGKIFNTTIKTLSVSKYFSALIKKHGEDGDIFIDRSGDNFEQVLSLLRDPQHSFPRNLEYELDFYQIDYDVDQLSLDQENYLLLKLYDFIKEMNDMKTYMKNIPNLIKTDTQKKCRYDKCVNYPTYGSIVCSKHKCESNICDEIKEPNANFCKKHKCYKCNNKVFSLGLCYFHY